MISTTNFATFHDLMAAAMEAGDNNTGKAVAIAMEWLFTDHDLLNRFVKPLARHACQTVSNHIRCDARDWITQGNAWADHEGMGASIDDGISPHAKRVMAAAAHDRKAWMQFPLMDGTPLGKATRPLLLANAKRYGLQARTMTHRGKWLAIIAQGLPNDTKAVEDHFSEARLDFLYTLASKKEPHNVT